MQPKISVIVPVYKTEKYLRRCVDSILAQTFTDFELLLIDDGSPDNCGTICDEYATKDSRVRVFHKENGGVSSARNLGLDNAQGEWITFVDSDDYVHKEYLFSLSKNIDVDLVVGSFLIVGSDENWNGTLEEKYYNKITLKEGITELLLTINFQVPWGKLLKRSIICKNNIYFDKNIHSGEDALFVLTYLTFIVSLRLCKDVHYFYERGNAIGLSHILHNIEHNFYAMEMFSNVLKKLEKIYNYNFHQLYMRYIEAYYSKSILYLYYGKDCLWKKYNIFKEISKNKHLILLFSHKNPLYRKKVKLFHFMMFHKLFFISYIYIYLLKGRIY